MRIEHRSVAPRIDPTAWVAPDATVCGNVEIGPSARLLHGARVIAEAGGHVKIGEDCIVMENAVVRSTALHPCALGAACLIGPNAHVVGAHLEGRVFVATGAAVFHGARLQPGVEVRIHAVVLIATVLARGTTVPIGWIAVGDPAQLFPPDRHEDIWWIQLTLNFPQWVYGLARDEPDLMTKICRRMSVWLGSHVADRVLPPEVPRPVIRSDRPQQLDVRRWDVRASCRRSSPRP